MTLTRFFRALLAFFLGLVAFSMYGQSPDVGKQKHLIFHDIRADANGKLLPWYADDPAVAYDFVLGAVWTYWKNIPGHWPRSHPKGSQRWREELKFPPKYLIYRTLEDQGIGGDQFAMMLSSWNLYYNYSGNKEVLQDMIFQADWYLNHGFSASDALWPNIPYPCNLEEAPVYDGDLLLGKDFTQPDKAGSFGAELVMLYKKTGEQRFLNAAIKIATTLSAHTREGDYDNSPLPFKVNAVTGEIKAPYTSNWTGCLRLFEDLMAMKQGDVKAYQKSFNLISAWLKKYPIKNNRWGPFFEDIPMWSDTEINEGTMALYMMDHPQWSADWKKEVRNLQDWVTTTLGIDHWKPYGLQVIGEQSIYKMQGQSHTARHAAIELMFAEKTGDFSRREEAIRQLNFCTYAVDHDGKCRWMNFDTYELWWTDGYGDFVRHFINAMAACPELASADGSHVLKSTSVISNVVYQNDALLYETFDGQSTEIIRTPKKPISVKAGTRVLSETENTGKEGFTYKPLAKGGVLYIHKAADKSVTITFY